MSLTQKQQRFLTAYLGEARFNATEAARRAGYKGSPNTLKSVGSENLTKPDICAAVKAAWRSQGMTAEEIIGRLSDIARASMAEFLVFDQDGNWRIDLEAARSAGKLPLLKTLQETKSGVEITLHSSLDALEKLARIRKMFNDAQIEMDVQILNVIMEALPLEYREPFRQSVEAALEGEKGRTANRP